MFSLAYTPPLVLAQNTYVLLLAWVKYMTLTVIGRSFQHWAVVKMPDVDLGPDQEKLAGKRCFLTLRFFFRETGLPSLSFLAPHFKKSFSTAL